MPIPTEPYQLAPRPRDQRGTEVSDEEFVTQYNDIYNKAQRAWDERYGWALDQARTWKSFAILGLVGTLAGATSSVVFAKRQQYVPYVVSVDSKTHRVLEATILEPSDAARKAFSAPTVIETNLRDFIQDWRTLPMDLWAVKAASDHVYSMLDPNDPATNFVTNWYRETDPEARIKKERVGCRVTSMIPMSLNTYEVVWVEDTTPVSGGETTHTQFRSQITVKIMPPNTRETVLANPSGIYVTSITEPQKESIK